MRAYVVDVCVAVKWFVPEKYSQEAVVLLNGSYSLMAPDYLLSEAGNVLWKKIRSKVALAMAKITIDISDDLDADETEIIEGSSRLSAAAQLHQYQTS